ncbi:hypothetical protein HK407_12g17580 [Ordospora pajunii]|uniref:uncharacterized protein n=1 Tax=Ordospora pajunii TaxID=3039483 RepID=UPI0029527EC7|nr:uncharacterized protein HK407_12g17580 [Ordospora pajunii]KAH9410627.1 hypothetical protein HK407_12g17580 [Ordospora pajunii]
MKCGKYNILYDSHNYNEFKEAGAIDTLMQQDALPQQADTKQGDLSLTHEASVVLLGTKYPKPRPRLTFSFIATAEANVVKLFFITITHAMRNGIYYGYDSSSGCVVVSIAKLCPGRRYQMYGRLKGNKTRLHCIWARKICYRSMCHQIF